MRYVFARTITVMLMLFLPFAAAAQKAISGGKVSVTTLDGAIFLNGRVKSEHDATTVRSDDTAIINLPVIGALFRSARFAKGETELMIIAPPWLAKQTGGIEQVVTGKMTHMVRTGETRESRSRMMAPPADVLLPGQDRQCIPPPTARATVPSIETVLS